MGSISRGSSHSIAVTENGRAFSWGKNKCGQLGLSSFEEQMDSLKLIEMPGVIFRNVSCGLEHSLLLSNKRKIYAFGSNKFGQIGNACQENQWTPIEIDHENRFSDISAHFTNDISVACSMNAIYYVWGNCKENAVPIPTETKFHNFIDIYAKF